jgi:hypothetical protein
MRYCSLCGAPPAIAIHLKPLQVTRWKPKCVTTSLLQEYVRTMYYVSAARLLSRSQEFQGCLMFSCSIRTHQERSCTRAQAWPGSVCCGPFLANNAWGCGPFVRNEAWGCRPFVLNEAWGADHLFYMTPGGGALGAPPIVWLLFLLLSWLSHMFEPLPKESPCVAPVGSSYPRHRCPLTGGC